MRITVKKEKIEQGVIDMFKVNMGIKSGEKLAVVTDIPTAEEWIKKESKEIYEMTERSLLAKMVSEISKESFLDCNVEFYPYPSVGRVGGGKVGDKFREMLTFEKMRSPISLGETVLNWVSERIQMPDALIMSLSLKK